MPKRYQIPIKISNKFVDEIQEILRDFNTQEQVNIIDVFLKMASLSIESANSGDISKMLLKIYDNELVAKFGSRFIKAHSKDFYCMFSIESITLFAYNDKDIYTIDDIEYNDIFTQNGDYFQNTLEHIYWLLTNMKREIYLNTSPTPQSKEGDEKLCSARCITIEKQVIAYLVRILSLYFDELDINDLYAILNSKPIDKKIVFMDYGNKLVDVFLVLKEKGKVKENKREIKEWICANFQYRNNRKVIKDFNECNVHKILTKQQTAKRRIKLPEIY